MYRSNSTGERKKTFDGCQSQQKSQKLTRQKNRKISLRKMWRVIFSFPTKENFFFEIGSPSLFKSYFIVLDFMHRSFYYPTLLHPVFLTFQQTKPSKF